MAKKKGNIVGVEIGREELRTLDLLPLSLASEKKLWSIVTEFQDYVAELAEEQDGGFEAIEGTALISKAVELFIENMEVILKSVIKKDEVAEDLLEEITNEQAVDIADKVVFLMADGLINQTYRDNAVRYAQRFNYEKIFRELSL